MKLWAQGAAIGGAFVLLIGCGKVRTSRAPGGGYLVTCNKGMSQCVTAADKACGEKGYTIVAGASRTKILGGENSSYQKRTDSGELTIVCGEVEIDKDKEDCLRLPERTDAPIESAPPVISTPGAQKCIPGSTQACVGPAACQGGQICAADGQGYGACDCGEAPARVPVTTTPAPAPAPRETAPSAPSVPPLPGAAPAPTPLSP